MALRGEYVYPDEAAAPADGDPLQLVVLQLGVVGAELGVAQSPPGQRPFGLAQEVPSTPPGQPPEPAQPAVLIAPLAQMEMPAAQGVDERAPLPVSHMPAWALLAAPNPRNRATMSAMTIGVRATLRNERTITVQPP